VEPSNEVVNGIHARVKARVEEFVVDPNQENARQDQSGTSGCPPAYKSTSHKTNI
jgi:hypothetical protein